MALELRVGEKYKSRNGETVGPLRIDAKYPDRFTDEMGNWYGDGGQFWQQPMFPPCQFSLVEQI